jgi:hypothetical protein
MTDTAKAFLTGNELTDGEKDEFIRLLISKNELLLAYEVWLTKTALASTKRDEGDAVFDGGFENITASDESGFGWQIEQGVSATAVAIDSERPHSGFRALHVKFAGNVEVGSRIVSQLVLAKPFHKYRLTFAVRSSELTSGGLPVVVVKAGNSSSILATSSLIKATDGNWVTMTVDFTTEEDAAVTIALERANCDSSPCPIFGEMSLDDFSIKEIGRAK